MIHVWVGYGCGCGGGEVSYEMVLFNIKWSPGACRGNLPRFIYMRVSRVPTEHTVTRMHTADYAG